MLAALIEWNRTNAEPPWTVQELTDKVTEAYGKLLKKMNQQLILADGCKDGVCDVGGNS